MAGGGIPPERNAMNNGSAERGTPEAFVDLLGLLLVRWRFMALATLLGVLLGGAYALLAPRTYQAKSTLLPRWEDTQLGLLGSVMEMTGLPVPAQPVNEGLYSKILCSNTVLARLATRPWPSSGGGAPKSLYELLDVDVSDEADRSVAEWQLFRKLSRDVLSLSRDKATGYMEVRATVRGDPVLAASLANAAVEELDRFNVELATTRAGSQFAFLTERLTEALQDLNIREVALTEFVKNNRAYGDSPLLLQQHRRLEREVEAATTVWVELRRQVELSKLEHQKNLSSIDVLDSAIPPTRPLKPNAVLDILLGACLGFSGAALRTFVRQLPLREFGPRRPH